MNKIKELLALKKQVDNVDTMLKKMLEQLNALENNGEQFIINKKKYSVEELDNHDCHISPEDSCSCQNIN